jgi:uroporphyrinogen decarboxylase
MHSRERVLAAINHQQPDKVPIDFGGMQTSIHMQAYLKLLEYLHIEDPQIQYADIIQHIAVPCEAVLQRFEIDTRYVRFPGSVKSWSFLPEQNGPFAGVYDQFGVFWGNRAEKPAEDVLYYDPVIHPLADLQTPQEIDNYDWPDGHDKSPFMGVRDQVQKLCYRVSTRRVHL